MGHNVKKQGLRVLHHSIAARNMNLYEPLSFQGYESSNQIQSTPKSWCQWIGVSGDSEKGPPHISMGKAMVSQISQ